MFLGKVVGTVWSTKKTPDLEGVRFLIVHPYDLDHEPTKNVVVVADRLGAGPGETVMCAYGKAARTAIGNQDMSIEAAVVGIVDRVDLTDTNSEELREAARSLGRDNGRPSNRRLARTARRRRPRHARPLAIPERRRARRAGSLFRFSAWTIPV